MGFVEFLADTGSNILGELIGGTLGEKVADFLSGRVTHAVSKNKTYKKYIKDSASKERFKNFFDTLNSEINNKHSAEKKAYKKAKTAKKRAELFLSEFCLYTGITVKDIKKELENYDTYNTQDDDFKSAVVDVILDMRRYYAERNLSNDNRALLSLLCSVIPDAEENAELIAEKAVAQLADRITMAGGKPTIENGARVVVKGITLTRLECPDCHSGILEELRSSNDKMFTCSNCGHDFAFGDLGDELKEKIIDDLENVTERLDAIYIEVNGIKKAIEEQGKKFESLAAKTVEETYEKTKSFIEKDSGISAEELSKKLTDSTSEIINGIKDAFTVEFKELKSNQNEQKEGIKNILELLNVISQNTETIVVNVNNLICEVESNYPSEEIIKNWSLAIKQITEKNYLANFCYAATVTHCYCADLYNSYIVRAKQDDINEYGRYVVRLLIKTPKYFDAKKLKTYITKMDDVEMRCKLINALEDKIKISTDKSVYDLNLPRHVFVVYAHEDIEIARSLVSFLEMMGLRCFIAERNLNNGLGSSDNYATDLMVAINHCNCVVFISTKFSRRLDHDTIYNLTFDKRYPVNSEYRDKGTWGELKYIQDREERTGISMPRIQYRPNGDEKSNDIAADIFVAKFFGDGTGTERYVESEEAVYNEYDRLITKGGWYNNHSNPPSPPVETIPMYAPKELTEADFDGKKMCAKDSCGKMCGTIVKFCPKCGGHEFYLTYEDYQRSLVKYCDFCGKENDKDNNFCSECGSSVFITYVAVKQKANSLTKQGDEAYSKKDYTTAISLYSKVAELAKAAELSSEAELGSEEANNKKVQAEQEAEKERQKIEKINSFIKQGDEAYNKKDFTSAINFYSQAAELGSEEANNKKAQAKQAEQEAEKEHQKIEKINSFIKQGDEADNNKDYATAIELYSQAENLGSKEAKNKKLKVQEILKTIEAINSLKLKLPTMQDFEIKDGKLIKYNGLGGNVVIPDGVKFIEDMAFANCKSPKSLIIPNSVIAIGNSAFSGCEALTSITIGSGVTTIGNFVFTDCALLASIVIPESVKFMGSYVFWYCSSLKTIYCEAESKPEGWDEKWINSCNAKVVWGVWEDKSENAKKVKSSETVTIVKTANTKDFEIKYGVLVKYYGKGGDVVIPDEVTIIGEEAFKDCTALTSVIV